MKRTRILAATLILVAAALVPFLRRGEDENAPGLASPPTADTPDSSTPAPLAAGAGDASALGRAPYGNVAPSRGDTADVTSGDRLVFVGVVLTLAGEPAAGATIEVAVGPEVRATVATDASGALRFQVPRPSTTAERIGLLRGRGRDGTVGQLAFALQQRDGNGTAIRPAGSDQPIDVGVLRLGPAHALDVQVMTSCAAQGPPTVWLIDVAYPPDTPFAISETDATGMVRLDGVPSGTWTLVASAPGCGRARAIVQLPRTGTDPVELALGPPHHLTVRVYDGADASPIAGATVVLAERVALQEYGFRGALLSTQGPWVTDATGTVWIDGLSGTETLLVSAHAKGYPAATGTRVGRPGGPGEVRVEPGQREATIELHRAFTVRWPLTHHGIGVPPNGSEVTIEPWTNTGRLVVPPKGTIEGHELVVPGWAADGASGYAVLADRASARLQAGPRETTGYPTAFYPLRRLALTLRFEDGSPAVGWFLVVLDGGNNAVKPSVATDTEGRAAMEGLYGGPGSLVQVWATKSPETLYPYALALGSVNLFERDGQFEGVIPAERTLLVRVTVEGRAAPADLSWWPTINHTPVEAASIVPDEKSGRLRVTWRPRGRATIVRMSAVAEGYLAETKQLELSTLSATDEVVVDLQPAGAVRIQLKEPADRRHRVVLDRWDAARGDFGTRNPELVTSPQADADGVIEVRGLAPGRYRAADTLSGLTSAPFDVTAGAAPVEVAFDLSTTGWVKGRVVIPEGASPQYVSVGEVGLEAHVASTSIVGAALPGTGVNADGTFWLRVAGTRTVTLRPYHPVLVPHPTLGRHTVTGPADGVELHLVPGPTARLRLATRPRVQVNAGQPRVITVRLYPGPVEGPGQTLAGVLDAEHRTVQFGGYEPGTHTVWIDVPGCAPIVVTGVVLTANDADLGEVALPSGASLELHIAVKDGQSPSRYAVWATRVDEPAYSRSTDVPSSRIVLDGLGAGRFRITAHAYDGAGPALNEEIEFDGRSTVVRELHAR